MRDAQEVKTVPVKEETAGAMLPTADPAGPLDGPNTAARSLEPAVTPAAHAGQAGCARTPYRPGRKGAP